jgi:hypothetical protein
VERLWFGSATGGDHAVSGEGVDERYVDYCTVDRHFYDSPNRLLGDRRFDVSARPPPAGWQITTVGDSLVYRRDGVALPAQGWTIHASANLDNADDILSEIWDYCVARAVAFEHLIGPHVLFANNSRNASHGGGATLATIYPRDDDHLERILVELGSLVDGYVGPEILSDLPWSGGPLHVRYGGFTRRYATFDRGEPEPAIEDPHGRLVPDRREAAFHVPWWVRLPEFLVPHVAARNEVALASLPYRIEQALHVSNGGGVHLAAHKHTGERVVLKEARPHAGLDGTGGDAVSRLRRERRILEHLAGLDFVPSVRGYFTLGERHVLVREYIEGVTLSAELDRRFPLTSGQANGAACRGYADWAVAVLDDIGRNVAALRRRGVVHGDLNMDTIILRPDGRISMIGFDVACLVDEARRPTLGHPALAAPLDRSGFDVDRYFLACLRLAVFLPLTTLFGLDRAKVSEFACEIYQIFPIAAGYLDDAVRTISDRRDRSSRAGPLPRWRCLPLTEKSVRDSMVEAILASATPERPDRLFPGDIEQFSTGGLNLAYGAAGVLYALFVATGIRHPAHEQWLAGRARECGPDARLGFYDGLHGVAYVLNYLGRLDEAVALVDRCHRTPWRHLGIDLAGGLAGLGLNLHHFAAITGEAALREAAIEVAGVVESRLDPADVVAGVSGGPHAGLMRGRAGPALMFIRLFESSGDTGYLDLAAVALDQDLSRCAVAGDGSLQVNDGRRTVPYLATGSIGIGLVLQAFLRHRHDERYVTALAQIALAAQADFYPQSGLFTGRAGALLFHSGPQAPEVAASRDAIMRQVRRLAWHAVDHGANVAFPGEQLYRLSMDLATGSAGVLLALTAAAGHPGATLPFLSTRALSPAGSRPV